MNRRRNRSIPRFTAPGVFWVDCRLRARLTVRTGAAKRAGLVTQEMMDGWVKAAGVELRGAGLDESPDCLQAPAGSAGRARRFHSDSTHTQASRRGDGRGQ